MKVGRGGAGDVSVTGEVAVPQAVVTRQAGATLQAVVALQVEVAALWEAVALRVGVVPQAVTALRGTAAEAQMAAPVVRRTVAVAE